MPGRYISGASGLPVERLGPEGKGLKKGDFKKKMKNGLTYFSDFVLCLEKYKRQQGSQSALSTSFKVDVSPKVQYTSKRGGHIEETVGSKGDCVVEKTIKVIQKMKANKIIEMSQEKSRKKVKLAMEEIQRMRNEGERITVSGLCKRTGLSNSFFYRNEKIKEEVHKAVDIQNQSYKMNIDEAELLDGYKEKLLAMRIEIIKLKAENQKLESELDTLRRQQKGVSDVK